MFFTGGPQKTTALYTLRDIRHDHILNFSEESLFEGTERTFSHVYVELPYPIHKPFETAEDAVQKLIIEKQNYTSFVNAVRKRYKRSDKDTLITKEYVKNKYMFLPQYLVDYYEKEDPDPCFNCDYNYYYTGGTLVHMEFENNDYLIRPNVNNTLCLTNVNSSEDFVNEVVQMNYTAGSQIYNINSTELSNSLYFVVREKNKASILMLNTLSNMSLKYTKVNKCPILDAKLSKNGKLGLIFTDFTFSLIDIERDTSIVSLQNKLVKENGNYQQFQFLDHNTLLIMDRRKLRVIDVRSKKDNCSFEPEIIKCNKFCNFLVIDNNVLISSRHYILKTDLRSLSSSFHYSHSLAEAPCYMDYAKKDSDTFLTVSGQNPESRVLFTGQSPFSLPYKIPSIQKTLVETRIKNSPLVLAQHLDRRLKTSLTGLKVLNLNEDILIFTSNYFGDIFKQKVHERETDKSKSISTMSEWSRAVKRPEPVLHLTHFEEIGDIRLSLNKKTKGTQLKAYYSKQGKEKKFLTKFGKACNQAKVKSELAMDFISIWDDDNDDEKMEYADEDVNDLPVEEAMNKVNSWIQTNKFE